MGNYCDAGFVTRLARKSLKEAESLESMARESNKNEQGAKK